MSIDDPQHGKSGQPTLPLVRLNLLLPFVEEMDRLRVNTDTVLGAHGITRSAVLDPDLFVSVNTIHRLLEDAAAAANDPFFGVHVGESLDFKAWAPLVDAAQRATSLADFLTRFILAASEEASSARHCLEIEGAYTFFRERRISEPDITPSQNDAFTAAYVLAILQNAIGQDWDPKEVLLQVCTPAVLPTGYHGIQVAGGDNRGMTIRFPSRWLVHTIEHSGILSSLAASTEKSRPPGSFLDALRQTIAPHLGSAELTVDFVAQLSGLSRQALQRRLKANGTTLSQEISTLKKQRAIEDLTHTDKPVATIGQALGFNNPATFTRAFKTWTGQSPRDYRKAHERRMNGVQETKAGV
jgi:AraC-like DNA-binding protein